MFDMMALGSLLSAGGGILDSILGGSEEDKAAKMAKDQFKFLKKMATAGLDLGNGNMMIFDGKNWKVVLNPTSRATQTGYDEEMLRQATRDMPAQRQERYADARIRNTQERPIYSTLLDRIVDRSPMTPGRLEADLYGASAEGITSAYDKIINDIATTALRTDQSGTGIASELARQHAKDLGSARRDARLQALTGSEDINAARTSNAINNAMAVGQKVAAKDTVPLTAPQTSAILANFGNSARGQAPQFSYAASNLIPGAASSGNPSFGEVGYGVGGLLSGITSLFGQSSKATGAPTQLGNQSYSQIPGLY